MPIGKILNVSSNNISDYMKRSMGMIITDTHRYRPVHCAIIEMKCAISYWMFLIINVSIAVFCK